MLFNINDKVRVKLRPEGRAAHRKNHDHLFRAMHPPPEYRAPTEDEDGWSEWQLWSLMQEFGPHITMGFDPPFETTIEILEKPVMPSKRTT